VEHLDGYGEEGGAGGVGLAEGVGGEEEELGAQHFAHARGDVLLELGEQGSVVGGGEAPQVFGADVVESSF
jgi:hypothetical protein